MIPMNDAVIEHLNDQDDPDMWRIALDTILSDLVAEPGMVVEVGACSHWLRPHQSRWSADGGFALPTGYGSGKGGYSMEALPQFDWSVTLGWSGERWESVPRSSVRHAVRVSIPSRTRRHRQAAVHTVWLTGKEKQRRFYGFRSKDGEWRCTAGSLTAAAFLVPRRVARHDD
jgi:hypothetical protein